MTTQPSPPPAEFSRPVPVERLPARGKVVKLSAEPAERAALAALFDLDSLDRLEATLTLRPALGGARVEVEGSLRAAYAQRCVITLAPVPMEAEVAVARSYAFTEAWNDEGGDLDLDPDDDDPPDPVVEGRIDLGALVAEELALSLDPYPRAAGVAFTPPEDDGAEEDETAPHPFAALAALRGKLDEG